MRKVTEKAVSNFLKGKTAKTANTEIRRFESGYQGDVFTMRLHGNLIASREESPKMIRFTLNGYNTVTTRERLNGILEAIGKPYRFAQRNHQAVIVWMDGDKQRKIQISSDEFYSLTDLDEMTAQA